MAAVTVRVPLSLAAAFVLTACGSVPELHPVPEELVDVAQIEGHPLGRFWGDAPTDWYQGRVGLSTKDLTGRLRGIVEREHAYLAISGGGENGAFGAGLLAGWTESGTRPEFTVVTGISTGSLTAPFAFLGPRYDATLKEMYTTYHTDQLLRERSILKALTSDSFFDSSPLRGLIGRYVSDDVCREIAAEHARGRRLFIGTTNLDAARPVIWNIGELVSSGRPKDYELARDVILASASIPGAFPPVHIQVEAGGAVYDELHVDGGTTSQVFLLPLGVDWKNIIQKLRVKGRPVAYILRNAQLAPRWEAVDPAGLAKVSGRAVSSLIRTQGIGDMYRIYLETVRDGFEFRLTTIPDDFAEVSPGFLDPEYMGKLYEIGRQLALSGRAWRSTPPGIEVDAEAVH